MLLKGLNVWYFYFLSLANDSGLCPKFFFGAKERKQGGKVTGFESFTVYDKTVENRNKKTLS